MPLLPLLPSGTTPSVVLKKRPSKKKPFEKKPSTKKPSQEALREEALPTKPSVKKKPSVKEKPPSKKPYEKKPPDSSAAMPQRKFLRKPSPETDEATQYCLYCGASRCEQGAVECEACGVYN